MDHYSNNYQNYSFKKAIFLYWDAIFKESDKARKLAKSNRAKDYLRISGDEKLLNLHYKLNSLIDESIEKWQSHDYGEGYFYQGSEKHCITGLRNSNARFQEFKLNEIVKDKTVLEIGCNSGFLTVLFAEYAKSVLAFDINPYIIQMGKELAAFENNKNIDFQTTDFENLKCNVKFDVILSFANHSTFDGNTDYKAEEFFLRCKNLLNTDGELVFESHHPQFEDNEKLDKTIKVIEKFYTITEKRKVHYGTFYDRGRTFLRAKLKND